MSTPMNSLSIRVSHRTAAVEEAAIIRMARKARALADEGHDIVSLTLGEPDFDTPAHIRAAAVAAMEAGYTHYPPVPGDPELREAIAAKLAAENRLDYPPDRIVVSNGAKQALTNIMFALLDEGDEVIVPAPCWAAYEGIIRMAGGRAVMVPATVEENFKVTPERIADAITPRSRAILLNSPANPSGAVYSRAELEALASVVRRYDGLLVVSDEIYEYIVFDEPHVSIGELPGMNERTVVINGFSKGFAMTGWRIGYLAAPEPLARAAQKVQGIFTAGANAFVQRAAIAALQGPRAPCEEMTASYRRRRDQMTARLAAVEGIRIAAPAGTFYSFPDVGDFYGRPADGHSLNNSESFCEWLLERWGVAAVPGGAFGNDRCIRLSFAASEEAIAKGLERIASAVASLQ